MKRKFVYISLSLCLVLANAITVPAGGSLEDIDITGFTASPIPGQIVARVVPIKWDARSIPVQYSMNNTLDPIPNPLGEPVLSLAAARAALQASFDAWNRIPTSFIEMNITGTTSNTGIAGFDFVNELTFIVPDGFGAIAVSPSTTLPADTTLVDGDDIDGDGDSDVSSAIQKAADVDGDGDIEFPEGFYPAGTVLENDVLFNPAPMTGFRFTVGDAAVDTDPLSVDLIAVATHEFGHSHGLSHTLDNQISKRDGGGSTMFPFIDTGDAASEIAQRSLSDDDIAWSSYLYPEGSASKGPAALQRGDIPFKLKYGLIKGELRHGVLNQPLAGGQVFAVNELTGERVVSSFSGKTQVSLDPVTGGLFLVDPAFDIIDGSYTIPVPLGIYSVGAEAVDGAPVPASSISLTAQIGAIFGQQDFNEEFFIGKKEDARERKLGESKPILVIPSLTQPKIDIVTADSININNFGEIDGIGFINPPAPNPPLPPGFLYAVQIPASQITAANPAGDTLVQGVAFDTQVTDASVVPIYARALLTTGVVNTDGTVTIDLARPLEAKSGFVGQDGDFAPFYFKDPKGLGRRITRGIADGSIQNLFIVLQVPTTTPYPGPAGQPPLIGLSLTGPRGSFTSADGGATWARRTDVDFRFSLVLSLPPVTP